MPTRSNITITQVHDINSHVNSLAQLLVEVVDQGASIGFIAPLSVSQAKDYWQQLSQEVQTQETLLFIATKANKLCGTIQLALCQKDNGDHRAEIAKLMVSPDYRQQGIAKKLINITEQKATEHQRSLLVLDTREGDKAEQLYKKHGYIEAGKIPYFAKNEHNELEATVLFYKYLA